MARQRVWSGFLSGVEGAAEIEVRHGEFDLDGTAGGDGEMDAPDACSDLRAELEKLQADGVDGSVCELGMFEADTAHGIDEHVSHRREIEPDLIGAEAVGGGAVGEEFELLADAVLRFAAA